MLSEQRLSEIAAVEAAAPKGPFTVGTSDTGALLVYIPATAPLYIGDMAETDAADHALADFIATARQAVPELLAEVVRLRALLAATTVALASNIQQVDRLLERA